METVDTEVKPKNVAKKKKKRQPASATAKKKKTATNTVAKKKKTTPATTTTTTSPEVQEEPPKKSNDETLSIAEEKSRSSVRKKNNKITTKKKAGTAAAKSQSKGAAGAGKDVSSSGGVGDGSASIVDTTVASSVSQSISDEKQLLSSRQGRIKKRKQRQQQVTGSEDTRNDSLSSRQRKNYGNSQSNSSRADEKRSKRKGRRKANNDTVPVVPGAQAVASSDDDNGDDDESSDSHQSDDSSTTAPGAVAMEGRNNTEWSNSVEDVGANNNDNDSNFGQGNDRDLMVEAELVEEGQYNEMTQDERKAIELETRQRVIDEMNEHVTQAEIVVGGDDRNSRRQTMLLSSCCCFAIIVSIILGSVLGTRNNRNGPNSPLQFNFTQSPTAMPSMFPTATPLNNSFCDEAIPVGLGESSNETSIFGSLENVYTNQYVLRCENTGNPYLDDGVGLWYKYVATNDGPVSARIITEGDADIQVYKIDDDNFEGCVGTCIDNTFYSGIGFVEEVAWPTVSGDEYYILVHTAAPWQQFAERSLDFELVFDDSDVCEMAFGPLPPSGFHVGSIASDASTSSQFVKKCTNSETLSTMPGVWYIVSGNGAVISASTCTATSMDTRIYVFRGRTCDKLECVDWSDDACGKQSLVVWLSQTNTFYYVLVTGPAGTGGSFSLEFQTENTTPTIQSGDFCLNAQSIDVVGNGGQPILLDFSIATEDPDMNDNRCYFYPDLNDLPIGIWYRITGSGQEMTIVLESDSIEDLCGTFLSIYTGSSCTDLSCLFSCTDDCSWQTEGGEVYYVFVNYHGGLGAPLSEVYLLISQ